MPDRHLEALLRARDDPSLQPVRAADRMRGDHDLVGAERPQRVVDRLQRIAVADDAARVDACRFQAAEGRVQPPLRGRARAVLVRDPVAKRRVEGRADDEHLLVDTGGSLGDGREQLGAADRLVRHDEDPPDVFGHGRRLGAERRLVPARANPPADHDGGEHCEDDHAEPGRNRCGRDDQREVADRQQQEAVRVCLAADGIPHRARGGTPSSRRRSTSRRRSASRCPGSRRRGGARACSGPGTRGSWRRAAASGRRRHAPRAGR